MENEYQEIPEVSNIRDLPWVEEEDLQLLGKIPSALILPEMREVLEAARDVFESSRKIESKWQVSTQFLKEPSVREFLATFIESFHRLKESASHTDIFCEFKDAMGNLCGSKMDIAVDKFGVYYKCRLDSSHKRTK